MPLTETKQRHQQGIALLNAGRGEEAVTLLTEVAREQSDNGDVWDHLAAALTLTKQCEAAESAFQQCLKLGVQYPETLNNAVNNAKQWRRPELQLDYAERLLTLDGKVRLQGLSYCAEALRKLGRFPQALAACRQILLEQPGDSQASLSVARLLLDLRQPLEAIALCDSLLEQEPDNQALYVLRIESLIASGDMRGGILQAEALLQKHPDQLMLLSALAFHYAYLPEISVAERLLNAQRFGAAASACAAQFQHWENNTHPERELHVGFVSGDLRQHPVGFFMVALLEALKESALRITVYDTLDQSDSFTAKIRPLVADWHCVQDWNDETLAKRIRLDGVDILVDLHGHTTGNRLVMMARKPAPVQLSWIGYLSTTGIPGMDYVFGDDFCVPKGTEDEFTETVWRLPNYYCFSQPEGLLPIAPPPVLVNGYITFGCLNKPDKINVDVLALWAKLLKRLPTARLLLKAPLFDIPHYRDGFVQRLIAQGIELKRVDLEGRSSRPVFLATFNRIDIALDPFPYSGGTSTAEALVCGVPVLALKGDRMVWRMAESLLASVGLVDWLAEDAEHFVTLAAQKAGDIAALTALRKIQREQVLASPLFDATGYADNFQQALRGMWRQWCQSQTITLE